MSDRPIFCTILDSTCRINCPYMIPPTYVFTDYYYEKVHGKSFLDI